MAFVTAPANRNKAGHFAKDSLLPRPSVLTAVLWCRACADPLATDEETEAKRGSTILQLVIRSLSLFDSKVYTSVISPHRSSPQSWEVGILLSIYSEETDRD